MLLALAACGHNPAFETAEAAEVHEAPEYNEATAAAIPIATYNNDLLEAAHATLEALREKAAQANYHPAQYQLLREFALIQNTGTVGLADIVIPSVSFRPENWLTIWDFDENLQPEVRPVFNVHFQGVDYAQKDGLIAELLAFTGIDKDNIELHMLEEEFQPTRFNSLADYLLVNQEYYQIARPYLRLREFATIVNSETTYYHEVIIRSIADDWRFYAEDADRTERFVLWFLKEEHMEDERLISELLEFAGLNSNQITFGYSATIPEFTSADNYFLQANTQLGELANQHQLLREFLDIQNAPTTRRGEWMQRVIRTIDRPSHFGNDDWRPFRVSLDVAYYPPSEEFVAELLAFTGIDRDFILFQLSDWSANLSAANQEFVDALTEEDAALFAALQAYMDTVNAPFWQNPRHNHPVIEEILPPMFISEDMIYDDFLIQLYDGDLLGFMPADLLLAYLQTIRADIIEATGIPSERLTIREEEVWSIIWGE